MVWMCYSLGKLQYQGAVTCDWMQSHEGRALLSEVKSQNELGEVLLGDAFPAELFGEMSAKEVDYDFTDFFVANGLPVISERLANTLRDFDLGDGSVHRISLMESDRVTPISGEWHFLNFGNAKAAFLPEPSKKVRRVGSAEKWIIGKYAKPDDIVVSSEAIVGPDIWVEPRCVGVFFLSDRLLAAITAEKFSGFDVVRCKVSEG